MVSTSHCHCVDGEADVNKILFEPLPELWRRPPRRPRSTWLKNINGDLTSFDMELLEATDAAQNISGECWLCIALCTHSGACNVGTELSLCAKFALLHPFKKQGL